MPTVLFKPQRKRPYYRKRSKILMSEKYKRQYDARKRKSILYQDATFKQFGGELSLVTTLQALTMAIQEFNRLYGDEMHPRHGLLCLMIKHYVVNLGNNLFQPVEIFTYYKNLPDTFAYFANNNKSFMALHSDLMHLHFINPVGSSYTPTTRLKVFCALFDKYCNELFDKNKQ